MKQEPPLCLPNSCTHRSQNILRVPVWHVRRFLANVHCESQEGRQIHSCGHPELSGGKQNGAHKGAPLSAKTEDESERSSTNIPNPFGLGNRLGCYWFIPGGTPRSIRIFTVSIRGIFRGCKT